MWCFLLLSKCTNFKGIFLHTAKLTKKNTNDIIKRVQTKQKPKFQEDL